MRNKKLFINLTNHSSVEWDDDQRQAAEAYGEITDMQFPAVDPLAAEAEVVMLAEDYAKQIRQKAPAEDITVHVMGEQTFCFALITKLLEAGIRCVASCTIRDISINADGEMVRRFHFTRFREYVSRH